MKFIENYHDASSYHIIVQALHFCSTIVNEIEWKGKTPHILGMLLSWLRDFQYHLLSYKSYVLQKGMTIFCQRETFLLTIATIEFSFNYQIWFLWYFWYYLAQWANHESNKVERYSKTKCAGWTVDVSQESSKKSRI